jgi:CDP-6-deoxy-D-xylo-4-hexulose-3-dehydrase
MTSGEGGMIICKKKEDYDILRMLRSHGWSRGIDKKKKNNFNFINSGFNLRPMDITAAIGLNQFKRMNKMVKTRAYNRKIIIESLKKSDTWNNQIDFLQPAKKINPSWFGLPILINKKFINKKQKYLDLLSKSGIETRPIISGNFLNQPAAKLYKLNKKKEYFKNAEEIDKRGFFIGLHTSKINRSTVKLLTNKLLLIDKV